MKQLVILSQMFLNSDCMLQIWILKMNTKAPLFTREEILENLPESISLKANRYFSPESAWCFLGGRLLLKKALLKRGLSTRLLSEISYSTHGKPSLKGLDFSISHSNGYVVLVFGTESSLGIDIEQKKHIDLKLFKYLFTEKEWNSIMTAENQLDKFYWYWVRKEALLKAAGCALKDLQQLQVFEDYGLYKNKHYYFSPVNFDTSFNGMLASQEKVDFEVALICLEDLI